LILKSHSTTASGERSWQRKTATTAGSIKTRKNLTGDSKLLVYGTKPAGNVYMVYQKYFEGSAKERHLQQVGERKQEAREVAREFAYQYLLSHP
jgi:hypothetical protein